MIGYVNLWRRLGHARWFGVVLRHGLARADCVVLRATRGRLSVAGPPLGPTLLLTTTGRRTGRPRTTPVFYVPAGDRFVVTSESAGLSRPAAWPLNADADPAVTVQRRGRRIACRARRATPAEVERFWPRHLAVWPAHATYERRSGRREMFVLEPAS